MPGLIQIDPSHPLGSLTSGPQQFTIAGDTDHKKESIHAVVNNDIAVMARNGVKHIMIEYAATPLEEMESYFPALRNARSWEDRIGTVDRLRTSATSPRDRLMLDYFREDLKAHKLLEDVYAVPPRIGNDGIRAAAKDYAAEMAEDPKASSRHFADLLIGARDAGIRVHFSGDRQYDKRIDYIEAVTNHRQYLAEHPDYAEQRTKLFSVPGYKIPEEARQAYQDHEDTSRELLRDVEAAEKAAFDARNAPEAEQARVDRILRMANGEKSVIVWGSGHAYKTNDFNEMLDSRLAEQARQKGLPAPPSTKVIELAASKDDPDFQATLKSPLMKDEPDVRFYIHDKEVEITPSGARSVELKPVGKTGLSPVEQTFADLMQTGTIVGRQSSAPAQEIRRPDDIAAPALPTVSR